MYSTVPLASAVGLERSVVDVMHAEPVTVPGSAALAVAAARMAERRVHAVLVCDDDGAPLGWLTVRGMLHNRPRDWGEVTLAREAITESVASVGPAGCVGDALRALVASGASHVLVRGDDGVVLGVVADFDLLWLLAARDTEVATR